jgi:hypothetical protein
MLAGNPSGEELKEKKEEDEGRVDISPRAEERNRDESLVLKKFVCMVNLRINPFSRERCEQLVNEVLSM